MEIELGSKVKDLVTGFEGIVTSRTEYLNGCIQYCIAPKITGKDKGIPDSYSIDVQQLKVIGKGVAKKSTKKKKPGGPMKVHRAVPTKVL